jgi:lysophospholipase L1-like esterase
MFNFPLHFCKAKLMSVYSSIAAAVFFMHIFAVTQNLMAEETQAILVPETYDYTKHAKHVASKFQGQHGVFLFLGDSNTYANQNTAWARGGEGLNGQEKAFVAWSHGGKRNDKDGWYLASVDVPSGRSHTAASGVRADQYLVGGKGGLPALPEIIKKYQPQLALYMLGTNDLSAGRPVEKYIADVEKAIDSLEGAGTVVILSTLPPLRGKVKEVAEYNAALRDLAKQKQVPCLDLFGEMKARAGDQMEQNYLSQDGVHLTADKARGPANAENLRTCGYLLRCYLAVHKGIEVKAKVFD